LSISTKNRSNLSIAESDEFKNQEYLNKSNGKLLNSQFRCVLSNESDESKEYCLYHDSSDVGTKSSTSMANNTDKPINSLSFKFKIENGKSESDGTSKNRVIIERTKDFSALLNFFEVRSSQN